MATKEQQLDTMLRQEQKNQLSSQEEDREQVTSKSQFRKPIKNPFSQESEDQDSDLEGGKGQTGTPFMQKPPLPSKTALQQAQEQMKWDKNEQIETEILAKLEGQGMKDKKIKQLAAKYKSLNIAYERQKTQRKALEAQLNGMMKTTTEELNKSTVSKRQKLDKSIQKSTTGVCTNCQQNEKKIMDFRVKNQALKSELNKATRVISRQLGQDFNIDQVLNQQNGWKGRQQKIQKLKSRVKQLQEKLNNNGINVSHMSGFTSAQVTTSAFNGTRTSALMAENKRKQLDNLKIQVDALKSENQILQGKVKSLVSRKVILENQMKQLKNEFQKKREILIQKSNNDDKFIELLKNENQRLKKEQKVVTKVIYKDDGGQAAQLKKQIEMLKKKVKTSAPPQPQPKQQDKSQQKSQQKQPKKVSKEALPPGQPPRVLSAEKKKRLQQQYLKGNKYLNKMSSQEQQQLYKNWKSGLNKN